MNKKYLITIISFALGLSVILWRFDFLNPPKSGSAHIPQAEHNVSTKILSSELIKLQEKPYDSEAYQLTYKTLLYNSHILDAYNLALIAVAKKPDDFSWHEKLAQTATWIGNYNISMREWLYVAQHTKDLNTMKQAASIATLLGYDIVAAEILKIYLANKPNSVAESLELANAQNRINQPEQALLTLQNINKINPTRAGYELTATIYQDIDEWDKALKTWKKIDNDYGPNIKSVMAQAEIYYTTKQFKQALHVIKPGIPVAKNTDVNFWQTMSSLAWMLNDRPLAILGYSHFLNDKSFLYNLIELEQVNHPEKALEYSVKGWHQFHQMIFFTRALDLTAQLKQWETLNKILTNLTANQIQKAEQSVQFWNVLSNMYADLGEEKLQEKILIQGIELHPEMKELKVNLLFLLMTKGDLLWIKSLLEDGYEYAILQNPIFWKVYADAFDVLNKLYTVLSMYQEHLLQNLQDNQLLIDYGHVLEKVKLNQQAYNLWNFLWDRTLVELKQEHSFKKKTYQTLSQVAPYFVSGTQQVQLLNSLFINELSDADLVILLNWMVRRNYFELITYFKAFYFHNSLPVWAGTNLALAHNDLPTLQKMVEHSDKAWSRSDLINAAVRMENIPIAIDLAFAELTDRPAAHEIYTEFTQYGIANANTTHLTEEYEKFVDVAGPRSKIGAKFRLTNTWKSYFDFSIWKPHSTTPKTITNVPSTDFLTNMKLEQKIHRGNLFYNLGYRKDLNGFIPVSINANYLIAPRWTALFKLGYNQENFQNAYMREGGVQDQLNLGLTGNVTQYDSVKFEFQGLNYYSQDRHYLADGCILEGLYEHKFWLSYPDYTIGLFGNLYVFNRNGSFGGDVTTLFPTIPPSQATPTLIASTNAAYYQALIPNNYGEGGFTFSVGNTILEYSHIWRPYLWASVYYNTITSLSNDLKLGINGSILGRDSLQIYAERGTAQSSQNQTNYMLGMRYMLYY